MSFTVVLPMPPPLNNLYANVAGKGRVKSSVYRAWRKTAVLTIFAYVRADQRVTGKFHVSIEVPWNMRGDIDGRIKPILDALVDSRRIDDDRHAQKITIYRGGVSEQCLVEVRAA